MPRPWLPSDAASANLLEWVFVTDATGVKSPGAQITGSGATTQWLDASSGGRNLQPGDTSNPPTYDSVNNEIYFQNGQLFKTAANFPTDGAKPRHFYVVARKRTTADICTSFFHGTTSGGSAFASSFNSGNVVNFFWGGGDQNLGPDNSVLHVIGSAYDGTVQYGNLDGGTTVSQSIALTTTTSALQLGQTPVYFQNGKTGVKEFVAYDARLSTADEQKLQGYLAWNNGTQSLLPAGHPYKSAAPTVDTGGGSQTATLAATEGSDTAAVAASSSSTGALNATEARDTAAATATTQGSGALAATEQPDTAAFAASQGSGASLNATEAPDTAAIAASTGTTGTLSAAEGQDTASGAATSATTGALAATGPSDTASGTASTGTSGTLAATEAPDTAAITAQQGSNTLNVTEQPDTAAFTAQTVNGGTLAATETPDTAAISATSATTGALTATGPSDTASGTATSATTGSLAATEQPDTLSAFAGTPQQATFAATEPADTAAIIAFYGTSTNATLAATEAQDTAAFSAVLAPRADFVLAARRLTPIQLTARRVA